MTDPLALCLTGALSPEIALTRLMLAGLRPDEIDARMAGLPEGARTASLRRLAARHDDLARVRAMLGAAGLDHVATFATPADAVAHIAARFDRAVAYAPLASVAAYSLDDATILGVATAELADWLDAEGMLGAERDVLDIGCGIGRVSAALAPRVRSVLGTDISGCMLAEARRRHGTVANLRVEQTSGLDLAALPDASFDLVLAVDSFPYVVQAGGSVADEHVRDAVRALRPGGQLAILNLSFRADPTADLRDVERWAAEHGLEVERAGVRPFALWDGAAWVMRRPALRLC